MTEMTALDAVCQLANVSGLIQIHDSGPVDVGRVVVFGDQAQAREYLLGARLGAGSKDVGVLVEVTFNRLGEVAKVRARVDGEPRDISGDRGNGGERLLWTLELFYELGARTPSMPREESDEDRERQIADRTPPPVMNTTHKLIGATIRATNRTYGLAPARDYGPDETVVKVNAYDATVYTAEGNCYLLGGYVVMRHADKS